MRITTELSENWAFRHDHEESFHPVELPHDWAIDLPFDRDMEQGEAQGFRNRFGIGWYRCAFELGRLEDEYLYLLEFGAVSENCTVWLNGKEAGGYKYGYSSFRLDVTGLIQQGINQMLVKVDTTAQPGDRWYSGAGIYRSVKLVQVEAVHLDPWEIVVKTEIEGTGAKVKIDTGLRDKAVRADLDGVTVQSQDGRLELYVSSPRLWSAENPALYQLTLSLLDGQRVADQITMKIGLREIQFIPNEGMTVNGRPVRLNGVCIHQDGGCAGIATKKEIFRQRLLALKEAGCNAIRPAHHSYSEEFLDLCDELGFYIYEECFDKWHGGLYGRYFKTEWQKDVDAMVKRDRNRPCIVMWGVGNEVENQGQDSMLETLKLLTDYVRTLDSRPISYAMNPHFKREDNVDLSKVKDIQQFVDEASDTEIYDKDERVERIARIAEYVDVISCNYQEQWYPMIHKRILDKLILGTESYQYFMGSPDQMQNFTEDNPVLAAQKYDYVLGSFIWTGIDYLGESMGWPSKGWTGSLIRANGSRRPSYYLMQSYWSEKPMVHFSVMDYTLPGEGTKEHWDTPPFAEHWHFPQLYRAVIPYAIMTNCQEVQLFLNGKRFYLPLPAECRNRMISGFLPYQPGIVEAVGLNNGVEVCRHVVRTPGMAVGLEFIGESWTRIQPETLPAEKGRQIQLSVRAIDKNGIPCVRESGKVRFRAEGPARVLAVDAGDLMSDEPYHSDSIHMYHGEASVLIALSGKPGKVCVYADGDGLGTARLTLAAETE